MGTKAKGKIKATLIYQDPEELGELDGVFKELTNFAFSVNFEKSHFDEAATKLFYATYSMIVAFLFKRDKIDYLEGELSLNWGMRFHWYGILHTMGERIDPKFALTIFKEYTNILRKHRTDGEICDETYMMCKRIMFDVVDSLFEDSENEDEEE